MIVLIDTDVVLDLLLDRAPFAEEAAELFSRVERGDVAGRVSAATIETVRRAAAGPLGASRARRLAKRLLSLADVAPVTRAVLETALDGKLPDFERELVAEAAYHAGARAVVTRNAREYQGSRVPAYLPVEILGILRARDALGG